MKRFDFVVTEDAPAEFCRLPKDEGGVKHDDVSYRVVSNCLDCRYFLRCLCRGLEEYTRREDERMAVRANVSRETKEG